MAMHYFLEFFLKSVLLTGNAILMIVGMSNALYCVVSHDAWCGVTTDYAFMFAARDNIMEVMLGLGLWTTFVGLVGSTIVGCRFRKGLIGYYILLLVSLCTLLVFGIDIYRSKLSEQKIKEGFMSVLENYKEGGDDIKSIYIDTVFESGACCGINDYTLDFEGIEYKDKPLRQRDGISTYATIPFPCCRGYQWTSDTKVISQLKDCLENTTSANAYINGCYEFICATAKAFSTSAVVIIFAACGVEILLGLCAIIDYKFNS